MHAEHGLHGPCSNDWVVIFSSSDARWSDIEWEQTLPRMQAKVIGGHLVGI